jgi:lipopolysaccharide export system protein LptA
MKHAVALLVVVPVLCAAASLSTAAEDDYLALGQGSDQPISITSKKFVARNVPGGKEASFDGEVKVKQGELTLECDKLTIVYDEEKGKAGSESSVKKIPKELQTVSGIRSITAAGNVKIVQNERMATAGKAQFDNLERTITLTEGPPQLWQGPDRMVAHTIIIYLDENRSELRSGDGTVIKAIINPGKQKREKR